jgi:hypothetical protein
VPGYPIRTPSDQRSVDSSPRTIAASHVLHRLLMPRHPPCALDNLTNTHIKKSRHKHATETKDARVHCTILNDHTNRPPHPRTRRCRTTIAPETNTPTTPRKPGAPVVLSGPNSVPPTPTHASRDEEAGLSGVSTFLEQPPPTPDHQANLDSERYWGPPPPAQHAQNTRL